MTTRPNGGTEEHESEQPQEHLRKTDPTGRRRRPGRGRDCHPVRCADPIVVQLSGQVGRPCWRRTRPSGTAHHDTHDDTNYSRTRTRTRTCTCASTTGTCARTDTHRLSASGSATGGSCGRTPGDSQAGNAGSHTDYDHHTIGFQRNPTGQRWRPRPGQQRGSERWGRKHLMSITTAHPRSADPNSQIPPQVGGSLVERARTLDVRQLVSLCRPAGMCRTPDLDRMDSPPSLARGLPPTSHQRPAVPRRRVGCLPPRRSTDCVATPFHRPAGRGLSYRGDRCTRHQHQHRPLWLQGVRIRVVCNVVVGDRVDRRTRPHDLGVVRC